jgi:hypothetical protein
MQKLDYNGKLSKKDIKLLKGVNFFTITSLDPDKYKISEIYYIENDLATISLSLYAKEKNLLIFKILEVRIKCNNKNHK